MNSERRVADSRSKSRARVLAAVRAAPSGIGVRPLSERTGLHPNTVRFHLARLEDDRLVQRRTGHAGAPGRPPLTFVATHTSDVGADRRSFAQLAEVLAGSVSHLDDAADFARRAGAAWGGMLIAQRALPVPRREPLDELLRMLIEVGFDPMVAHQPAPGAAAGCMSSDAEASTVLLHRHCPFLEVARTHPDVVCSLHLGLIQGALDSLDAPISAGPLIPFARPEGCELTIRRAGSDTPTTPSSRPSPPTTT